MARRRSEENGLKRQQRLESEQRKRQTPHPDATQTGAVPPGVAQLVDKTAPPFVAPRPED